MKISVIRSLRQKASHLACNNVFYNWSLGGSVPEGLILSPPDSWPGDAEQGRWLCGGSFIVAGEQLTFTKMCWEPEGVSEKWLTHMHSFDWLRDLRAFGGDDARRQACSMIESWILNYPRWHEFAWKPALTGRRLAHTIALYDFYGASVDHHFEEQLLESLARQARHLSRALPGDAAGLDLLYAIKGLAYAGLAFSGREAWLEQALDLLQEETGRQILPDGGHISRSPQQLLEALRLYIDIRAGLQSGGYPVPEQITHTIDRMAQAIRFFRYADKGFAVFNGSQEGDEFLIDTALFKASTQGRVVRNLPHTGYERVTQGRSMLMMDTGNPPAWPHDLQAHAAPLAFEFMYGKERIFVSCGAHPLDDNWQDALRATAAHNTLCVDHRNACEISDDRHFTRCPRNVRVQREESRDAVLLDGSHDGYVPLNGVTHARRLYLGDQGHDLRGEDVLSCDVAPGKPIEIAIRFHIHPKIQVSLIQDDQEALLRLAGGAGWRFFHTGGVLALEDSIYLGEGAHPRKTKQLVIHGLMESDNARVKWALRREGR